MPRLPNISNPPHPRTVYWTLVVAVCGVLLLAGLTLNSSASGWISEGAQAEVAGSALSEPAAVRLAQPAFAIRTVAAK